MIEVTNISANISANLTNIFTGGTNLIMTLLFFTLILVGYSVFVFYFYRYLAKKNLIELNLSQYNKYSNRAIVKSFAIIFYILEYIVILPVLTFFWFAVLAILILILSEGLPPLTILLISAALVAAVRITSYISESLSKDLAKMLPFTLIAIAITKPGFFAIDTLLSRIQNIPSLFSNILYYLLFIIGVELIMRTFELLKNAFRHNEEIEEEIESEEKVDETKTE